MIGKPVALIRVPNQRLFALKAAARYLGVHPNTLRQLADSGVVTARRHGKRRVFLLEDLDRFVEDLPEWVSSSDDENPFGKAS